MCVHVRVCYGLLVEVCVYAEVCWEEVCECHGLGVCVGMWIYACMGAL